MQVKSLFYLDKCLTLCSVFYTVKMNEKQQLIDYFKLLHPDEEVPKDISFDRIFFKVHGITHEQYLHNEEELNKKINRLNYEEIPQRKTHSEKRV